MFLKVYCSDIEVNYNRLMIDCGRNIKGELVRADKPIIKRKITLNFIEI